MSGDDALLRARMARVYHFLHFSSGSLPGLIKHAHPVILRQADSGKASGARIGLSPWYKAWSTKAL
jgi:hypothetical protein